VITARRRVPTCAVAGTSQKVFLSLYRASARDVSRSETALTVLILPSQKERLALPQLYDRSRAAE
jgi:hypothetical protein